jgi:hypothetical protein
MRRWFLLVVVMVSVLALLVQVYGAEDVAEVARELPYGWILPLVVAVVIAVVKHVQGGRYYKYLQASFDLNRIVYSAIEEAKATDVKTLVSSAVLESGVTDRLKSGSIVQEINDTLVPAVDPKKAQDAPAIVRFWRRFLAGKNLPGVAARVAANAVIQKHIKED